MITIKLSHGYEAIVDDEDYEELSKYKWCACKEKNTHYAARSMRVADGKCQKFLMHRQIMGAVKGIQIDHIDGNGLNNTRNNLRIVSERQNAQNRHDEKTSKYTGVTWNKATEKWRSQVYINGQNKYLGCFKNEIDAYNAYLEALSTIGETCIHETNKNKYGGQ